MSSHTPNASGSKFDAAHWKRINDALDQALELDGTDRETFLEALKSDDAALAVEVEKLLDRAQKDTSTTESSCPTVVETEPLATAIVRPGLTTELATVYGKNSPLGERGFDGLLQRALRAERNSQKSSRYRGELCGAWKLVSTLGSGGMGEVWLAERADGLYTAQAAVKFLRPDPNKQAFEARFAQERALLARLNHPGIARLIDAGRQFGNPFLVLEYVEGMPLLNYLVEYAHTVEQRLKIFRQIVEAVSYAHTQLVVHRDLKPSNVLVTPAGQVKLLDFGVAGLLNGDDSEETTESAATKIAGRGLTIEYAAPEQISGEATGVASDVYSLGALGFHMLCGHRAYLPEKSGRAALEHAVLHTDAPRLSEAAKIISQATARDNFPPPSDIAKITADLDAIFARALRRDPQSRYRTADELLADLRRFAERRPISARREDRAYRGKLWLRRNWLPAALSATLVLTLAGGLGVSLWQADRAREEALRANKTAAYLSELLSGADPDLHGGNWPTVLNLIERAQTDIATQFKNEPSVEQKLSHNIATTLRRLSRFQDALPIAQRSYVLSQALYGDKAESTRMAGALLADILYWIDRDDEAFALLDKVIGQQPANPVPEWWREAFLLQTNLASNSRKIEDAHAGYDKYRSIIRGHPQESWLEAEAETDRALTMMLEGRHREALLLHKQYRQVLANPPEKVAKRVGLNNLSNGLVMSLYMAEPNGLEEAFDNIRREWDNLAGPYNQHSVQAVYRQGLFYYFYDQPQDAVTMFKEKLRRSEAQKTRDETQIVFARIDILEAETKYFMRPAEDILRDATDIEEQIRDNGKINQTMQNRFLQRLALVRSTFGDITLLAKSVLTLSPKIELGSDRADRAATQWRATAELLMTTGHLTEACTAISFAADQLGERNRVLIATPLYLRAALSCALASSPDAARHLAAAKRAIPDTLPQSNRLRYILEHVERVVYAKTAADVVRSQHTLAEQLQAPALRRAHPGLPGLVF
jgi:eukaryotic-like serine/threonine-protein kinase